MGETWKRTDEEMMMWKGHTMRGTFSFPKTVTIVSFTDTSVKFDNDSMEVIEEIPKSTFLRLYEKVYE